MDIAVAQPSAAVAAELADALAELCPDGAPVAVRSSASDEDGAQHSFAGQLDSFLFVAGRRRAGESGRGLAFRLRRPLLAYRREHNLAPTPTPPDRARAADGAGGSGRRRLRSRPRQRPAPRGRGQRRLGLGTALVSGDADADTYHVDRDGTIVERAIADKRFAHRAAPGSGEGVEAVPVPEDQARRPALTDEQVRAVADLVRRTGRHFGRPQDIEWAIESGPTLSAPVAADHFADADGRPRRRHQRLGQQQHRRELQRRDHAADVLLRPPGL